jgi:3-deoxy-D-manno-octulosonate 8-phosphate phosphatase (KDO 8-P phosphatase)
MAPARSRTPGTATLPRRLQRRAAAIEILLLDVDGVMTDGAIVIDNHGVETKAFHVRDGSGIKLWQQTGRHVALITGRESHVVAVRAAELGIERVRQGVRDKLAAMQEVLVAENLNAEQACFVGDDLPDLPAMRRAGLAVAVADACSEARAGAHYVTRVPGGRGAVRELVELLLKAQNRWNDLLRQFDPDDPHGPS